jgi:hypothetical protein
LIFCWEGLEWTIAKKSRQNARHLPPGVIPLAREIKLGDDHEVIITAITSILVVVPTTTTKLRR